MQKELIQGKHLQDFLFFGDNLITDTRELVIPLWQKGSFESKIKADKTPVSDVDLQCEEMLREKIRAKFPEHGIIGEEFGAENENADFVWTIDPIDGTQNLINHIPTFGTIIGLLFHGRPVLGWIDHPVLDMSLRGGVAVGSFYHGTKLSLPDLAGDTLGDSDIVGTNCPGTFGDQRAVLDKVLAAHPHTRMYYDVFSHTLCIQGALSVMVEYNLKIWDLTATQALIEGAGGVFEEVGRIDEADAPTKYHAVFGKKRAVELLCEAIA